MPTMCICVNHAGQDTCQRRGLIKALAFDQAQCVCGGGGGGRRQKREGATEMCFFLQSQEKPTSKHQIHGTHSRNICG